MPEGDSSTTSSGAQNGESSSTSDSEDASPQSEERDDASHNKCRTNGGSSFMRTSSEFEVAGCVTADFPREEPRQISDNRDFGCMTKAFTCQLSHLQLLGITAKVQFLGKLLLMDWCHSPSLTALFPPKPSWLQFSSSSLFRVWQIP